MNTGITMIMRKIMQKIAWLSLLSLTATTAAAEFEPEAVGKVETLPATYPDHWVMVHDFSFFHMMEGEIIITDPLAEHLGSQYKGMIPASFTAAYARSKKRNEHYVAESFFARGTRGGERTDVLTIWDPATLEVSGEVIIPPKRITGMPKTTMIGLIGDDRFLGVYNFTPGQSVSIVDLEKRTFVGEIPTAGCAFLIPNGKRSFTSICSNGSMLTSHLDREGKLAGTTKTPVLFDPDNDPIFEAPATADGVAYFPTFWGNVMPVDVSGKDIEVQGTWSLLGDGDEGWRPGGIRPAVADADGMGYFLMHPEGGEGSHKNPGSEVWVYDLAAGKRLAKIELENWGLTVATSGRGDDRLMFVTNVDMGVDVYRLSTNEFVHTLNLGGTTPFMVHGAE